MLTITIKVDAPGEAAQGVKEHLAMCLDQYKDVRVIEVREDDPPEQMRIGR